MNYRDAWQERAVLVRFSIPSAACGIVAAVAMWFCNSTLVTVKGYAELADFHRGKQPSLRRAVRSGAHRASLVAAVE